MINNKFTMSLMYSLLATVAVSAMAGSNTGQPLSPYSLLLAGSSSNPWALPPAPEKAPNFQRSPQYGNQPYQEDQTDIQYPGFRFVTPEILESLKQQQMQTQQVQRGYPYRQYNAQQSPPQLMSEPPQGYYGFPSPAAGFANPLYDTPAVSPWGNGPDVMYRGQSFPWVPDAAIGGIPPMNVQPFTGNSEMYEAGPGRKQGQNNIFNPFTFGPNGNL
jgi:hypothetical protein